MNHNFLYIGLISSALPEAKIIHVKRNPAADLALETRRLKLAIEGNVLTTNTASNGMGNIDPERMKKALVQLAENYKFENSPNMSLYYTDKYLPSDGSLMIK